MKVSQNDETNPNMWSVNLPHAPSMLNMEHSPYGHLSNTGPEPGKHSWLTSPFAGIVLHYIRTPLAPLIAMSSFCVPCIYCFFPLFSFDRPRDRWWCRCDPLRRPRPLLARATRQANPPLSIPISPISFPLMLALELLLLSIWPYSNA